MARKIAPFPKKSLFDVLTKRERLRIQKKEMYGVGVPSHIMDVVQSELDYRFAKTKCDGPPTIPRGQIVSLAKSVAFRWSIRMKMEMGFPVKLPDSEATAEKRRRLLIDKATEEGRELTPEEIKDVIKYRAVNLDDPDTFLELSNDKEVSYDMNDIDGESPPDMESFSDIQLEMLKLGFDSLPAGLMRFARHLLSGHSPEMAGDFEGLSQGTAISYRDRIQTRINEIMEEQLAAVTK